MGPFNDIGVEQHGHVTTIEIRRPPNNFFDIALIQQIADALEAIKQHRFDYLISIGGTSDKPAMTILARLR